MSVLLEAAVESLDDALTAVDGGADRLELCANLAEGGTTPDRALLATVLGHVGIPVLVMIRPRGGDFVYSSSEIERMRSDLEMVLDLGAGGVVLGALDVGHRVDSARTEMLANVAGAHRVTFHRAIDRTLDLFAATDALLSLGISRVLTSGGASTATAGAETLAALVRRTGERMRIVAGGGVRAGTVRELVRRTGVREVHARCGGDAARIRAIRDALDGAPAAAPPA